jgi:hypothetical protein
MTEHELKKNKEKHVLQINQDIAKLRKQLLDHLTQCILVDIELAVHDVPISVHLSRQVTLQDPNVVGDKIRGFSVKSYQSPYQSMYINDLNLALQVHGDQSLCNDSIPLL